MNNNSPYFTGAAPNFGPPSGLAALIQQDRAIASPGQQGWHDLDAQVEKFKQTQDMGKAADYFVKANPDVLSGMGIHEEEWKTLGARDKSAAITGFIKGQAQQQVMQELAETARKARATQAFGQTMGRAQGRVNQETLAAGNGPVNPRALTFADFAAAAAQNPDAWTAPQAAPLVHALAQGSEPGFSFNPQTDVKSLPNIPGTFVVKTSRGGGQVVQDPTALAAAAEAKRKPEDGMIEIPDPENPVFGPRIRIPLSVAKKDYPHLLKGLGAGAPTSGPAADKKLTLDQAKEYLNQAGGDKEKARAAARKDGYTF